MSTFFVDTSVIIDYIKGKESARELMHSAHGALVSSYFCLAELYEGIERVSNPNAHEKPALTFFRNLKKIYGLDMHIAKVFGKVRAQLKKDGNVIEDIDIFIAATCLAYDLTLITFNKKHFSHIGSLKIL